MLAKDCEIQGVESRSTKDAGKKPLREIYQMYQKSTLVLLHKKDGHQKKVRLIP